MSRIVTPVDQYLDDAGNPLINGQLHFFEVGTATLKDTFADASLTIPNSNPVLLDGAGRTPNIYGSGSYRMTLNDSEGAQIWERDNVTSSGSGAYGSDWNSTVTYDKGQVVFLDGIYYISLINANVDNSPDTSPASWIETGTIITTVHTSSDANWVPNPVTKSLRITAAGGGAGGGGVNGQGVGTAAVAAGGSGAGTATLTITTIDSTYAIVIGAAGIGGIGGTGGADGTDGGNTSVTSSSVSITSTGGVGGIRDVGDSIDGGALGSNGSNATGGDYSIRGGDSHSPRRIGGSIASAGNAGGSFFGAPVRGTIDGGGKTAVNFGCGGSGASSQGVDTDYDGGDGFPGVVITEEFI